MKPEQLASLAREITREADDYKKLMTVRENLDNLPVLKSELAIANHDVRIDVKCLFANLDTHHMEMAMVHTIKKMWPEIMARLEADLTEEIRRIQGRFKEFA